jgi:hypothetical protein
MGAKSAAIPLSLYLFGGNFNPFVVSCYERAAGNRGIGDQLPSFLCKRVTTEIRAMASAFCLHQSALWGGAAPGLPSEIERLVIRPCRSSRTPRSLLTR